jgi:hypothetical protein
VTVNGLGEFEQQRLVKTLQKPATFFSLLVDETTDVSTSKGQ